MSGIVFNQIDKVKKIGMRNLFDVWAVQRVGSSMNLKELVNYLDDISNWGEYWDLVIFGNVNVVR